MTDFDHAKATAREAAMRALFDEDAAAWGGWRDFPDMSASNEMVA